MAVSTATHCMIYVTCGSMDEARTIGNALIGEKLAACANIMDGVTSIYRWKGKVEEGKEAVLIAKSRFDLAGTALERVKELHSNEVPCAVAYEMTLGLTDYLGWIDDETAG
ncbi:MAG: divalent-cation tolerance protein CutA [Rhodospirillaceae bacterium]